MPYLFDNWRNIDFALSNVSFKQMYSIKYENAVIINLIFFYEWKNPSSRIHPTKEINPWNQSDSLCHGHLWWFPRTSLKSFSIILLSQIISFFRSDPILNNPMEHILTWKHFFQVSATTATSCVTSIYQAKTGHKLEWTNYPQTFCLVCHWSLQVSFLLVFPPLVMRNRFLLNHKRQNFLNPSLDFVFG